MSRFIETGRPGGFNSLRGVRFLAGTDRHRVDESRSRAADPAARQRQDRRLGSGTPALDADWDPHAESLDDVAGSEFIDDRIRLRE
jgi:hypothetical protein